MRKMLFGTSPRHKRRQRKKKKLNYSSLTSYLLSVNCEKKIAHLSVTDMAYKNNNPIQRPHFMSKLLMTEGKNSFDLIILISSALKRL